MHLSNEYLNVFSGRYDLIYNNSCLIKNYTITYILTDIKKRLDIDYGLIKKIYSNVNELLENTMIHQNDEEEEVEIDILKSDDCYRIITFNIISIEQNFELL